MRMGLSFRELAEGEALVDPKGRLLRPRSRREAQRLLDLGVAVPGIRVIGFDTQSLSPIENEILESEGLSREDFGRLPRIFPKPRGSVRPACFSPGALRWRVRESADGASLELRFHVSRGMYATILLRDLMKPEDPLGQGF